MDKLSFLKGLALGLAGKPLEFAPGKEPVPDAPEQPTAFFYGHVAKDGETPTHIIDDVDYVGAILPPLPEWDKTVYPYAWIVKITETVFHLFCMEKAVVEYWEDGRILIKRSTDNAWQIYDCSLAHDTGWTYFNTTNNDSGWFADSAIWSNFGIYNEDGTPYLAESACIPIYE